MHDTNESDQGIRHLLRFARQKPFRWLLPALLIGGISVAYALVYQPDWEARQALTVREDHAESAAWSGQFDEADQLKHAQEIFLELARSPNVISAALQTVGPPASYKTPQQWPTLEDVAATSKKTNVAAPNGMEFGTTRMFYLSVAALTRQRAIQLATAICNETEQRFKKLRDRQTNDAITELTNTVKLATEELDKETATLREMETIAGSDLAELRMLSESFAGGSNLQTTLAQVRQELRQAEQTFSANQQLLNLLTAAQEDPAKLVATPNRLLEAQPSLRRLKDGLVDAQLSRSRLLGTMSLQHPRVRAAIVAEEEIRGDLHRELEGAVRGLGAEQTLFQNQIRSLKEKTLHLRQRLETLAEMRASYTNQLAEVRQRTASLTRSQQELNATRASLAAGNVISLVTRVDTPRTGPFPQGPSRSLIAAAGGFGGLLVGLGILVLTMPASVPTLQSTAQPTARPTPQIELEPAMALGNQPAVTPPAPACPAMPTAASAHSPVLAPGPMPPLPLPSRTVGSRSIGSRNMTLKEALMHCGATAARKQ